MGVFDGIASKHVGGAGAVLYINRDHYYLIRLGCVFSTNSRAELLAIYGMLYVANIMGFPELWAFGDSTMVIDRVNKKNNLRVLNLDYWCNRIDF